MRNIKESVEESRKMTPQQIAERSIAFRNKMSENQALKDRTANLKIQDAYNGFIGNSGNNNKFKSFGRDFGNKLKDLESASMRLKGDDLEEELIRLKAKRPVMAGYNTPETARSYKSDLNSWDTEMKFLQNQIAKLK